MSENKGLWEGRYFVSITVNDFSSLGHTFDNVRFVLFRADMDAAEASELLKSCGFDGRACDDAYVVSQVEETFDAEQVRVIQEWVAVSFGEDTTVDVKPALLPREGRMGVSALPVGGFDDVVMFCKQDDYSLAFKVEGYYNLHGNPCRCHRVAWQNSYLHFTPSSGEVSRLNVGINTKNGEEVCENADL